MKNAHGHPDTPLLVYIGRVWDTLVLLKRINKKMEQARITCVNGRYIWWGRVKIRDNLERDWKVLPFII